MVDSRDNKGRSFSRWPNGAPAGADSAPKQPAGPASRPPGREQRAGRVVHDERGNAVWNWVKETGRFCLDSTSALLKKLDFGNLQVEGEKEEGLRLEDPGRDAGGGYDPYNQKIVPKKIRPLPPKK